MRRLPLVLAAFLWVMGVILLFRVAYQSIQGTVDQIPLVGAVLSPETGAARWLPYMIFALFTWVIVDVGMHGIWYLAERVALAEFSSAASLDRLRGLTINAASSAGRRRDLIVAYLRNGNREALHDTIPGAAAADAARVDESFSHVRALLWVIPVLGFIGTAVGLSGAIGGFATALKVSDVHDPNVVVSMLGQKVIPGLAGAFTVTMLALGTAAIGHLCQSAISSAFQNLLRDLDAKCLVLLGEVTRGSSGQLVQKLDRVVEVLSQIQAHLAAVPLDQAAQELHTSSTDLRAASAQLAAAALQARQAATAPYNIKITRDPS